MTTLAADRASPSPVQQWWVLTIRVIAPTIRSGEVFVAIGLSIAFTASLYIPLKQIMGAVVHGSYAQWIMPSICLQAVYFAAMSGALRSATDSVHGINRRLASMPVSPVAPMAARMSGNLYRCATALATAIVCGHVIGFRFYHGPVYIVAFCALVLIIGVTLSFIGDLVGRVSTNPEATTHILLLPELIWGILSVGIQPADQFPEWIQPVVRNQPHSQFVYSLRAFAGNFENTAPLPSLSVVGPALAWLAGFLVVTALLYVRVLRGRR
jgi:ABC-2 type transport system permease protein